MPGADPVVVVQQSRKQSQKFGAIMKPVCTIIGAGPGLGDGFARVYAKAGYDLALLSRSGREAAEGLEGAPRTLSVACDAADPASLNSAFDEVTATLGATEVLIYNADLARFGTLDEITEEMFQESWQTGVLGLYATARRVGREMAERGSGTIVIVGATASLRGNPFTTAFAPTKASQRILAQALAKQFGPKGVHVAYLVIDGVIDTPFTRESFAPGKPDSYFLNPDHIALTALNITQQDRSAWTFETDLRPFGENW